MKNENITSSHDKKNEIIPQNKVFQKNKLFSNALQKLSSSYLKDNTNKNNK